MKSFDLAQRKKRLHRLIVAQSDIFAAYHACAFFLQNVKTLKDPLYEPLFLAIVVCYARPFVDSKGFGRLPRQWEHFQDGNLQAAHNDLLRIRHEIVAHSDAGVRKVQIVPPGATLEPLGGTSPKYGWIIETYRLAPSRFCEFFAVFRNIIDRLEKAILGELEGIFGKQPPILAPFPLLADTDLAKSEAGLSTWNK